MSLIIDPFNFDSEGLREKIAHLRPTPGYCFLIDIVGSTQLKDEGLANWIIFICNTFNYVRGNLYFKFKPLKSIGDELMFFIPDTQDAMQGETALTLLGGLWNVVNNRLDVVKDLKIGAAYCDEAYEIGFLENTTDVYGKDIDLTARLTSVAGSREIIMNSKFVSRVRAEYGQIGNKDDHPVVRKIVGPWPQSFKGFLKPVDIFKVTG